MQVGIYMMLQEDVSVAMASQMAMLGLFKYALTGQPEPWEPQAQPKEEEPEEDVKVHVEYLDNGYFDDHFDLTDPAHLTGKALVKISSANPTGDQIVDTSLQLLGWTLFEKVSTVGKALNVNGLLNFFIAVEAS